MGQQIIKQPNGMFALYSSIIDGFVLYDATPADIVSEWDANSHKAHVKNVAEVCAKLDKGEKPYYQFTLTWEQALTEHESRFGKLVDDDSSVSPKPESGEK